METTKKLNKKGIIIGIAVLALLAAVFAAVYFLTAPQAVVGAKNITVDIIHSDETVKAIDINTDAEYLRQALEEKELIEGTESSYGLFITTVDGETADDSKQQWWCITQSGEDLMTGVDSTPVKDGDKFEITLTVGY